MEQESKGISSSESNPNPMENSIPVPSTSAATFARDGLNRLKSIKFAALARSKKPSTKTKQSHSDAEAKEWAKKTRLNTRSNSGYMKCIIELMDIPRPATDSSENVPDIDDNLDGKGKVEVLNEAMNNVEIAEGDSGNKNPKELMVFDECVEYHDLKEEHVIDKTDIPNTPTSDENTINDDTAGVRWNRRVSVTKFNKRKAPKQVAVLGQEVRRSSLPVNFQPLKPIIKSKEIASVNDGANIDHKGQDETALLSPTRYTIKVGKLKTDQDLFEIESIAESEVDIALGDQKKSGRLRKRKLVQGKIFP